MHDTDIYVKTDAGRDAIASRDRALSMAVRAILLMVDGQRSVASIRTIVAGSKAPADTLETLEATGLIALRGAPAAPIAKAPPVAAPPARRGPDSFVEIPGHPPISTDVLDLVLPTVMVEEPPAPIDDTPFPDNRFNEPPLLPEPPAERSPRDRYEHLYAMINEVVRDFLPAHRRYFIQLKIERCANAEELVDILHDLREVLAKSKGDAFANDVVARLRNAA